MKPSEKLRLLTDAAFQVYIGRGIHTLGLIDWVLQQIGRADIIVTTFSTSVEFLSGFYNLRRKGLVGNAMMIADVKAAKKTQQLNTILCSAFDEVYLCENHSKVVLMAAGNEKVSIISSQNNTYGGRIECTYITTDAAIYDTLNTEIGTIVNSSLKIK